MWTNSEDEILKVAVMKYGLNHWSKISSLLPKKTANQCKARWYEWLDPSIKKTEWTREEEEKLLHLTKIFPNQWRTIAPMVGRTPAQCVEHYEKLLDQAQGKEEIDDNDPRKLRPGEIDPNPETRPARPDPIDMDEDEKQMLAEARARIPNTKGKKARRRERTLKMEEAKRLAGIQKTRELKAAGIEVNLKKKIKGVDYNEEVPFEKAPLEMVYEIEDPETPQPNLNLANISLQFLEGKRRDEEEEEARRKLDEKKMKRLKDQDFRKAVEKISEFNNPFASNNSKLVLPGPQLQDRELEEMGKLNYLRQGQTRQNEPHKTRLLVTDSKIRQQTKSSLLNLPRPRNDYQIEMPELNSVEPEVQKKRKLDAEDNEILDRKAEPEKGLISQAVRKNFPRPYKPNRQLVDSYLGFIPEENDHRKEAEQLLADEMLRMVSTDAAFYSFQESFGVKEQDLFNENELDAAARLLNDEMNALRTLLRHGSFSRGAWEEANKNIIFDENAHIYIDIAKANKEDRILFARNEFEAKKYGLEKESKMIEELQKKVNLLLESYPNHGKQIQVVLAKNLQDIDQYKIEQEVFKQIQMQEQRACYTRFAELKKFYEQLAHKETELQRNHEKLISERDEAFKVAPIVQFI